MFGGTSVDEPPINIKENPDGTVELELNPNINMNGFKSGYI